MENTSSYGYSSELERQRSFLSKEVGEGFDFGLVFTQAFLRGIRDIGYKSTASALFELIDNSIEAEAENIHIVFGYHAANTSRKKPDKIAIIDDGHGMDAEMIRVSVLWGGSHRVWNAERTGFGKYGYGLPSSCVSIGERFSVYSKLEDEQAWKYVPIDIQEIGDRDEKYIDPNTNRIVAPAPKPGSLPGFVDRYAKSKSIDLSSGTVIVIERIDRLTFKTADKLKNFLLQECGVTYRNYLRSTNMFVDGHEVDPIDPLFATEGFRYYDEDDDKAILYPPMEIPVRFRDKRGVAGTIKARFSYMPVTFLRSEKDKIKGGTNNKRFYVRKGNNGILVLRAGRQIDVVNAKCPWTTFQNNDRYIGVELDFPPSLDEEFSITTSKQQVVLSERMWDILFEAGVYSAITELRNRYKKDARELKERIDSQVADGLSEGTQTEQAMKESAVFFQEHPATLPKENKREADDNFKKEVQKRSEQSGMPEDQVQEVLQKEIEELPYKISFIDEEEGPFYRAKQIGGQLNLYINTNHRFYTDLYRAKDSTPFMRSVMAALLFVLAENELKSNKERKKWYQIERSHWSQRLTAALDKLSDYYSLGEDFEQFAEEAESN